MYGTPAVITIGGLTEHHAQVLIIIFRNSASLSSDILVDSCLDKRLIDLILNERREGLAHTIMDFGRVLRGDQRGVIIQISIEMDSQHFILEDTNLGGSQMEGISSVVLDRVDGLFLDILQVISQGIIDQILQLGVDGDQSRGTTTDEQIYKSINHIGGIIINSSFNLVLTELKTSNRLLLDDDLANRVQRQAIIKSHVRHNLEINFASGVLQPINPYSGFVLQSIINLDILEFNSDSAVVGLEERYLHIIIAEFSHFPFVEAILLSVEKSARSLLHLEKVVTILMVAEI